MLSVEGKGAGGGGRWHYHLQFTSLRETAPNMPAPDAVSAGMHTEKISTTPLTLAPRPRRKGGGGGGSVRFFVFLGQI